MVDSRCRCRSAVGIVGLLDLLTGDAEEVEDRGVEVEDVDTTAKTLPGFAGLWQSMVGGN